MRFVGIVLLIGLVAGCSPKPVLSRAGRISYEWHIPKTGR